MSDYAWELTRRSSQHLALAVEDMERIFALGGPFVLSATCSAWAQDRLRELLAPLALPGRVWVTFETIAQFVRRGERAGVITNCPGGLTAVRFTDEQMHALQGLHLTCPTDMVREHGAIKISRVACIAAGTVWQSARRRHQQDRLRGDFSLPWMRLSMPTRSLGLMKSRRTVRTYRRSRSPRNNSRALLGLPATPHGCQLPVPGILVLSGRKAARGWHHGLLPRICRGTGGRDPGG